MSAAQRIAVVTVRALPPRLEQGLEERFLVHRPWRSEADRTRAEQAAGSIRAIVTGSTHGADAAWMERYPRARIVACFGVGVDTIDLRHAALRGVAVTNTPDVLTEDCADMAVALLLATARRIPAGDRHVREGRWPNGAMAFTHRVHGKCAGIVGLGRIGAAVARRLEAFSMTLLYHGPNDKRHPRYRFCGSLPDMARESDFLIVTSVGGEATRHLIGADVLDALGPDGVLVNIARGSCVDESALIDRLAAGRLRGAGLDVFAGEPRIDQRFLALDNVVLSPHQASATHETRAAMADLVLANLDAHFAGKPLISAV